MSVTLSIDGPHFTSGQIKLSEIRSKFGGGNNFGSYKKNTDTNATDPIVPDATENSAISTGNNLKFSQFRGSVKSYTATQSGTDENTSTATWPGFRMGNYFATDQGVNGPAGTGIRWNSNLNKNIKKTVNITGTCGSRTTTHAAAQLDPSATSSCVEQVCYSNFGIGFVGDLCYGNGEVLGASNGSNCFITTLIPNLVTFPVAQTAHNNVIYIYTTYFNRYPESFGYDYWLVDFYNKTFSECYNTIISAYNVAGGENDLNISKGGLLGNRNNCGVAKVGTPPPSTVSATSAIYNLTINVLSGARILGARGSGGIANGGNGGNGGIGLRVYNTGAKNLIVSVKSGALVAGGGGGGGAGTVGGTGGQGGDGLADGGTTTTTIFTEDSGCNLVNQTYRCDGNATNRTLALANYLFAGCEAGPNVSNTCGEFGIPTSGHGKYSTTTTDNPDTPTTGGTGGPGGNGGNGGNGEGYDGTDSEGSFGAAGTAGTTGGTNAGTGGNGGQGGRGGEGGTFGANGSPGNQGNTGNPGSSGNVTGGSPGTAGGLPVGSKGTAGKAIDGLNYILNPSPPPSGTIKGTI